MRVLILIATIMLSALLFPRNLSANGNLQGPFPQPVTLADFRALPRPAPTTEIRYGPSPSQAIDLFLPRGPGPYPVALLIHGGCWSASTAGREQLRHLGAALADRGIAVWSIGYRRANEEGGGYPGTFEDVATAVDLLPAEARRRGLDLSRSVLVGHSAGGHLALWAAAREGLPAASPLHRDRPFVPATVISLAGVGDLESFSRFVPLLCGPGIIDRLVPAAGSAHPYAEISPAALPAPGAHVVLVSGVLDRLVPPYVAYDYVRAVPRADGASVEVRTVSDAGHFDLVTPGTPAWAEVLARIERAVAPVGRAGSSPLAADQRGRPGRTLLRPGWSGDSHR